MSPMPDGRHHRPSDFYHENTNFQFIKHSKRWAALSGILIIVAMSAFFVKGLNLSIDFKGGTVWNVQVAATKHPTIAGVRTALGPLGLSESSSIALAQDPTHHRQSIRVEAGNYSTQKTDAVAAALAKYGGVPTTNVSVDQIGPTWGQKVSHQALKALIVFFILVAFYLSFRFEWKMALAALVAMLHDIIIPIGLYAVTGLSVTPATVVAILTILGFSLYDTVVVFDKVRDNAEVLGGARQESYGQMVNRSLNQVLMRSLNTSLVALLPVGSLLIVGTWLLGAEGLRDFGVALFVGLLSGTYSSIFVAAPLLVWLKEKEPRFRTLREKIQLDVPAVAVASPQIATTAPAATPPPTPDVSVQARPRRQRRKRR